MRTPIAKFGLGFALLFVATLACAQDAAREKRWESEVMANLVVGDAVRVPLAGGASFLGLYAPGKPERPAVLLVHGLGVHPDHGVIGQLRVALNDAGYATLSIQMPVLAADARGSDYFPQLFPNAGARIAAGARWLAAKGAARVALLSHSLGAWMSEVQLRETKGRPFVAWLSLGRGGAYADLSALAMPLLDVMGEADLPQVRESAAARAQAVAGLPGSRQLVLAGADHFYTGREAKLAAELDAFLRALPAGAR